MENNTPEDLLAAELTSLAEGAAMMRLSGEVDIATAHVLRNQFETIAENAFQAVIIDATAVTFMDSTGLHSLVEGKRLLHDTGTRIVLVPSRQVRRVLELVFPEPLFAARVDSIEEALNLLEEEREQEQI